MGPGSPNRRAFSPFCQGTHNSLSYTQKWGISEWRKIFSSGTLIDESIPEPSGPDDQNSRVCRSVPAALRQDVFDSGIQLCNTVLVQEPGYRSLALVFEQSKDRSSIGRTALAIRVVFST